MSLFLNIISLIRFFKIFEYMKILSKANVNRHEIKLVDFLMISNQLFVD